VIEDKVALKRSGKNNGGSSGIHAAE